MGRSRIRWEHVAALLVGLLWLVLALDGARKKSFAMDELPHLGAGLSVLRYGDFRMNPEHPPLFKALAALPVELVMRPAMIVSRPEGDLASWADGNQWFFSFYVLFLQPDAPQPVALLLILARLVPILTGLAGGIVAWFWGAEIGGRRAGLFAMTLLLFYSEYLGHARFVTLDVPTLVCCGALSLLAWRWWKRPTWVRAIGFAVAGSILVLVKLPILVFLGFLWAVLGVQVFLTRREWRRKTWAWMSWAPAAVRFHFVQFLGLTAVLIVMGYTMQWAAAGFRFELEGAPPPLATDASYARPSPRAEGVLPRTLYWVHQWRLLPEATIGVFGHVGSFAARRQFLLGESKIGGWYHYFLVSILLKTPFALLLGLPLLAARLLRRGQRRGIALERLALLAIPFLLLFALMVQSRVNIGHRHILFIYFPWCVLLGAELASWTRRYWVPAIVAGVALLIVVGESVLLHPHHATYFNQFVGRNPADRINYLMDSNVDWGQDVSYAAALRDRYDFEEVNLAVFGGNAPEAFGLGNYRWVLPNYPFAIGMPEAVELDPRLPTITSANGLLALRFVYPGRFERDPIAYEGSLLIFAPERF